MDKRPNYEIEASFFFVVSALFFIYGLYYVGVFSRDKYFVKECGYTGPAYLVIIGELKLKLQMPDTIENLDCGGINVVWGEKIDKLFESLDEKLPWFNYYVLTGKIVGADPGDGTNLHPLIEVTGICSIDIFVFWLLTITDITMLGVCGWIYRRDSKRD